MSAASQPLTRTLLAWVGAGLTGVALACFFVMLSFAFHGALRLPTAALIGTIVIGTIGAPTLALGLAVAVPIMALARAWVWPRPASDCAIGVILALAALTAGHILFSPGRGVGRGIMGPFWVDVMCAVTLGAIAGSVYWRLAGEPRPPYSRAKPRFD